MDGVIEKIKDQVSILDYASRFTTLKPRSGGRYHQGACPIPGHDDGKTPSFCVWDGEKRFKCFGAGCNKGGDIIDLFRYMNGIVETADAIVAICKEFGIDFKSGEIPSGVQKAINKKRAREIVQTHLHDSISSNSTAMKYLSDRQVTPSDIERWGIGVTTGRIVKDLSGKIPMEILNEIGIAKDGKDALPSGIITLPVMCEKKKISHWHLKHLDESKYQMFGEHREEKGIFFNAEALTHAEEQIYIVEGPWEVIQLERRGFHSIGLMGTASQKQISALRRRREILPMFPELEKKMKYAIWLDRDDNKAGQMAAKTLAMELFNLHEVTVLKSPKIGQDPDDFFREGGVMTDVECEKISSKPLRVESVKGAIVINKKDDTEVITDFNIKLAYTYKDESGEITRQAILSKNGTVTQPLTLTATDLIDSKNFTKWVIGRGNFNFYGNSNDWSEVREYLFETDSSRRVSVSQSTGHIHDKLWLFDNGAIVKDGDIWTPRYADKDGITWIGEYGFEGIKTPLMKNGEVPRIIIPEKWNSAKEIVDSMYRFFPVRMVHVILGYAVASIFRKRIFGYYKRFPLLLLYGETTKGKTTSANITQAFAGAANIPEDSCKSTSKAFMRHLAKYHSFPMHLSEYVDSFEPIMKNIYDGILYSQAWRSTGYETIDPVVHSPVVFTCEHTPSGRSLLNRTVMIDFTRFDFLTETKIYEKWFEQVYGQYGGFGFLIQALNSSVDKKILDTIFRIRTEIDNKHWQGVNHRIALTYSVIYGAFASMCECMGVGSIVKACEPSFCLGSLLDEIHDGMKSAHDLVHDQDILSVFFSYFNSLYIRDNLKGSAMIQERKDLRYMVFNLDSVFNEIINYDSRGRRAMQGIQKEDISQRIRLKFGVLSSPGRIDGRMIRCYSIPIQRVIDSYGVSFEGIDMLPESELDSAAEDSDDDDANFDPTLFDNEGAENGQNYRAG